MFDSKTKLTGRLADAVDLLIDFATLGEYGLESTEVPGSSCEGRRRPHAPVASRRSADRPLTARA
ncbi:MAG TPA: hypothetical protein VIE64_07710 [Solirubrobacterales bacterium]